MVSRVHNKEGKRVLNVPIYECVWKVMCFGMPIIIDDLFQIFDSVQTSPSTYVLLMVSKLIVYNVRSVVDLEVDKEGFKIKNVCACENFCDHAHK